MKLALSRDCCERNRDREDVGTSASIPPTSFVALFGTLNPSNLHLILDSTCNYSIFTLDDR